MSTTATRRKYIDKLRRKRIVIFGGSSGIGFAVAEAAIEHGASVVLTSSNAEKLHKASQALELSYPNLNDGQIMTAVCDLAELDTLATRLETFLDRITSNAADKIDHIVYTADDAYRVPALANTTPNDIYMSMRMRVFSSTVLASVLSRTAYLVRSADNSVTFTNGASCHKPVKGWAVPAMAATALEGLIRGLAVDLAPMRVNLVSAGFIGTEMMKSVLPEMHVQKYQEETLTKTVGRPEDVAETYLYLMKDGFVTGSILFSDGGRRLA